MCVYVCVTCAESSTCSKYDISPVNDVPRPPPHPFPLLPQIGPNTGNIMLLGHAATLEATTRQLIGQQPRPAQEFVKIVQKVWGKTGGEGERSRGKGKEERGGEGGEGGEGREGRGGQCPHYVCM